MTVEDGGYKFGEKHIAYMKAAFRAGFSVAEGAVRAGKTVDNVFVFAALLETSPDKIHLATGSTIGNAKMNIGECGGLGLEHIFRGRCRWRRYLENDALEVDSRTGVKVVIFAGGKNQDSFKKIRGNSYGMWIATEINLHTDSFIKEALNRQLAAKDRRVFWDLNPSYPAHFIYTDYIDLYRDKSVSGAFAPGWYNYGHFTIADNPLITEERMNEIVSQYEPGSVWYRRDILGERCSAEGLIYRAFADKRSDFIVEKADENGMRFINIGVDFGGSRSRTTFAAAAFMADGGITFVADHAVKGGKGDIDPERVNSDFLAFLESLKAKYPTVPVRYVFADCEAQYLITGLRRAAGKVSGAPAVADCKKYPVNDRIAYTLSLMARGKFHLCGCPLLEEGLACAVWDEAHPDRRLDNFTSDIDILDAAEYAIERYMKK